MPFHPRYGFTVGRVAASGGVLIMPGPPNLNSRLQKLLCSAEKSHPGIKSHAERVSVYSVAVGGRLGFSLKRLTALRLAAEIHDLGEEAMELRVGASIDELSMEIVKLCEEFDCKHAGCHGHLRMSDDEALAWLKNDAGAEFDVRIVDALRAVQPIIQPIET